MRTLFFAGLVAQEFPLVKPNAWFCFALLLWCTVLGSALDVLVAFPLGLVGFNVPSLICVMSAVISNSTVVSPTFVVPDSQELFKKLREMGVTIQPLNCQGYSKIILDGWYAIDGNKSHGGYYSLTLRPNYRSPVVVVIFFVTGQSSGNSTAVSAAVLTGAPETSARR